MSVSDVTTFYQTELSLMGWVEDPNMSLVNAEMVTMIYNMDGEMLSVSISNDPNAGTSVMVFSMDE